MRRSQCADSYTFGNCHFRELPYERQPPYERSCHVRGSGHLGTFNFLPAPSFSLSPVALSSAPIFFNCSLTCQWARPPIWACPAPFNCSIAKYGHGHAVHKCGQEHWHGTLLRQAGRINEARTRRSQCPASGPPVARHWPKRCRSIGSIYWVAPLGPRLHLPPPGAAGTAAEWPAQSKHDLLCQRLGRSAQCTRVARR